VSPDELGARGRSGEVLPQGREGRAGREGRRSGPAPQTGPEEVTAHGHRVRDARRSHDVRRQGRGAVRWALGRPATGGGRRSERNGGRLPRHEVQAAAHELGRGPEAEGHRPRALRAAHDPGFRSRGRRGRGDHHRVSGRDQVVRGRLEGRHQPDGRRLRRGRPGGRSVRRTGRIGPRQRRLIRPEQAAQQPRLVGRHGRPALR
jgi:hypothetical protein